MKEFVHFLFNPERVLLILEGLGQAGVDLCSLRSLIENVSEDIDALDQTGADFLGSPLLLAQPDGPDGQCPVEHETGKWTGTGRGDEAGQGVDDGFQGWLGLDHAKGLGLLHGDVELVGDFIERHGFVKGVFDGFATGETCEGSK